MSTSVNPTDSLLKAQYDHGYNLLGPVFAQYLSRLEQNINAFEQQHDAKVLFAARAGIRIRRLYEAFTSARGSKLSRSADYLWISRFMTVKGLWNRIPETGCKLLAKEFASGTCADVIHAIYRAEGGLPTLFPIDDPLLRRPAATFWSLMQTDGIISSIASSYLSKQSELFQEYFRRLMNGKTAAVIVDSGWQGTTQLLMQEAYPEIDWWGLYWGRSYLPNADTTYAGKMLGLMFEADDFTPDNPMSSIILHRHLIEGVLEPRAPSIERFVESDEGPMAPESSAALEETPTKASSALFCGILDYINQLPDGGTFSAISKAYKNVAPELACILAFPSRDQAVIFGTFERSADFGRNVKVPVLSDNRDESTSTAEDRIASALWTAGQIAIEYPPKLREARQTQALGMKLTTKALRAASNTLVADKQTVAPLSTTKDRPSVAIIMRTLDRPILLERAILSVASQTFTDYILVIVCDGGQIDAVHEAVEQSAIDKRRVIVIDNVVNRGMEAASNIAIAATDSEYIVIHDDDDSWDPDFLKKTVTFMNCKRGLKYGGVITHSWYVSEQVTPDGIVFRDRRGYQDWVDNVQFMELCCGNFFPPIAFVFRRSVYNAVGKFDERLPVLGDWDFNLRFVLHSDIGVIKEKLAFYHHRDIGNTMYPNSVIGDVTKHAEFCAIMRNKYLRSGEMPHETSHGRAYVSMAHVITDIRNSVRGMDSRLGIGRRLDSLMYSNSDEIQAAADDRWVALHFATVAAPLKKQLDDISWRADCHWVQLQIGNRPEYIFTDSSYADRMNS